MCPFTIVKRNGHLALMISTKVPDPPRKTEAPLFWIRLVDPDTSWNPDSADTFSVAVFSDTGV